MNIHISKKKAAALILIPVAAVAAIIVSIAAYGNYKMSLIPQMTSEEILEYTLKGCENGVRTE